MKINWKQLFCWHKWHEIEMHPEHNYQCYKCLLTKK